MFSVWCFRCLCFWCHVQEVITKTDTKRFLPIFPSTFSFYNRVFNPSWIINNFLHGVRRGSNVVVWHVNVPFSPLLKRLLIASFPHCVFSAALPNSRWPYTYGFISGLCSIPSVDISVFMPVPHCFDYCSTIIYFEIWKYAASTFVLVAQNGFGYSVFCGSTEIL